MAYRVCVVSPHFPPLVSGMSTMVHDICSYLHHSGHDVSVVTPRYLGLQNTGGFFSKAAEALNRIPRGLDVIHAHCGPTVRSAVRFLEDADRKLGARTILTLHGGCPTHGEAGGEALDWRCVDEVTCPSIEMCRELRQHVTCPVTFIPNGVDLKTFHPPDRPGGDDLSRLRGRDNTRPFDGCPVIVYTGRLDPGKGVMYLVSAVSRVTPDYPDISLVLAGAGYLEPVIPWCLEALDPPPRVRIVHPPARDLPDLYRAADIAVLPSTRRECCPRALIEAMATGLPAVGSDIPGVNNIIENSVTGLTSKPRDTESLSKAIIKLASHDVERERMGKRAARKAASHHDLTKIMQRYLETYSNQEDINWIQ